MPMYSSSMYIHGKQSQCRDDFIQFCPSFCNFAIK